LVRTIFAGLALLGGVFLLDGCLAYYGIASAKDWTIPKGRLADFKRDQDLCENESWNDMASEVDPTLFKSCMQARGWQEAK
jgi:hypothetical protein